VQIIILACVQTSSLPHPRLCTRGQLDIDSNVLETIKNAVTNRSAAVSPGPDVFNVPLDAAKSLLNDMLYMFSRIVPTTLPQPIAQQLGVHKCSPPQGKSSPLSAVTFLYLP
jgi:hypothetical protein